MIGGVIVVMLASAGRAAAQPAQAPPSSTAQGATSMGRAEVLRQLPGAFGDPFRALDALPGVTPIVSGLPFFYVRGAPPANVGYFLGGGRGTALVAGRYSYTAAIRSLIAKDTRLGYRDYEARVTCEVTPDDRLSLLTFGSYNLVARTAAGIESVLFASEFYRLDTR